MKQVIFTVLLTVTIIFGVIEFYKLLPMLVNDKFRGSYDLTIDETKTKSNLYPPKDLKVEKIDDAKVALTWNFDRKEFVVSNDSLEYGILSGYRIYKDGYWHKDINLSEKKFIDEDLLPNETYVYEISALTFDNKIEGTKSSPIKYTTSNFALNKVNFPITDIKKYLAEGDSITVAENVPAGAGWAELVAQKFGFEIHNKAVSGSTSYSVKDRIESEVKEIDPDLVTIAIGVNDIFDLSQGNGNVSISDYHDNLKSIIKSAKGGRDRNVVLLNIFYINCCQEKHKAWDREVRGIANSQGVLYIDVSNPMIENGGKTLLVGDLHPNAEGYRIISETVIGTLTNFMK